MLVHDIIQQTAAASYFGVRVPAFHPEEERFLLLPEGTTVVLLYS